MVGSVLPVLFLSSSMPLIPPLGLLALLAWRLVRPGLMPVWAGLPLGAFDDLFSGQPFGSAILLWSAVMIAVEIIEERLPWRNFVQDWGIAVGLASACLVLAALVSGADWSIHALFGLWPQLLLTVLLFPIIARIVARLDRLRLTRWRKIG